MIHRVNPLVAKFKNAAKALKEPGAIQVEIRLRDDVPDIDTRTYNRPTTDEVAVILPDYDQKKENRKLVVTKNDGSLKSIHPLNPIGDPAHYVLLFPFGDPGYEPNILQKKSVNPRQVTALQFYRFRLMVSLPYTRHNFNIYIK